MINNSNNNNNNNNSNNNNNNSSSNSNDDDHNTCRCSKSIHNNLVNLKSVIVQLRPYSLANIVLN